MNVVVTVLAATNVDVLAVLGSNVGGFESLSAPLTDAAREDIEGLGFLSHVAEDLPQLLIQVAVLAKTGKFSTVRPLLFTLFSRACSCLLCCKNQSQAVAMVGSLVMVLMAALNWGFNRVIVKHTRKMTQAIAGEQDVEMAEVRPSDADPFLTHSLFRRVRPRSGSACSRR